MFKLLLCLWFLLLSQTIHAHAPSKTITIYGIDMGRQLSKGQQRGNYILQIAAFQSQANAIDYQKRLAIKTAIPIQMVVLPKQKTPFMLIAGPFKNSTDVKTLSQQLASTAVVSKRIALRQSPSVSRKPAVLQTHTKTIAVAKPLSADKDRVMDSNAQEANHIAFVMRDTKTVHVGSSPQVIERRTAALQAELTAIHVRLQRETEPSVMASLEKRQHIVRQELSDIMNMVITRISRK